MSDDSGSKKIDSELQRRRLVYLVGEAVEKISRMQRILDRQRVFADAEHKQLEYSGPINTLAGAIDKFRQELTSNSVRIASVLRDEELSNAELKALLGAVQKVLHGIHGIHELFLLLPREAPEPQVFFVLRDCFNWQNPGAAVIRHCPEVR